MYSNELHGIEGPSDHIAEEQIVEIGPNGQVYAPGQAPRSTSQKPSILRDPFGEYCMV